MLTPAPRPTRRLPEPKVRPVAPSRISPATAYQTEPRSTASRPPPATEVTPGSADLTDEEILDVVEVVLDTMDAGSELDPFPGSRILPLRPGPEGGLATQVRRVRNIAQMLKNANLT